MAGGNRALSDLVGTPAKASVGETWRNPTTGKTVTRPFGSVQPGLAKQGFAETNRGSAAVAATPGALPGLIAPINMDQATLEQTPGYKFNLAQGLKATQNSVGARGLGISGASEKGAASYATGLASSTYQQQFQNALANKQMTYQSLFGPASLGESAAAGVGSLASGAGSGIATNLTNIGTAQAGADLGAANAVTGAANSAGSNALIYAMLQGKGA
jgi:hypothetical protein